MKQEIAYLVQRMSQEAAMAAAATLPSAKRAHDTMADAFYARIVELENEANGALRELGESAADG